LIGSNQRVLRRTDLVRRFALIAVVALGGCATLPDGSRWGDNATFRPGWSRVGDAALTAVTRPSVWVPLIGAAALQIDGWDRDAADWAFDHAPVFGSPGSAADASDNLRRVAAAGYVASVLGTPSGDFGADWILAKAKGGLVGAGAIAATGLTTEGLKSMVSRDRPNGSDDASFPSGHASATAVLGRLTARNLDVIPMNAAVRTGLQVGTEGVSLATAWARVEAGEHYPSDVLFGMALGNFFATLFDAAFLGGQSSPRLVVSIDLESGGGEAKWRIAF
jgi:membrane-associated phospholipid phosphatase